jgi:ribosomal protein S19
MIQTHKEKQVLRLGIPRNISARRSLILITDLGKTYKVHNGKIYQNLVITKNMIGKHFGDFILTKKQQNGTKDKS